MPIPTGITITEYELPAEVQKESLWEAFQELVPPEARLEPRRADPSTPPYVPNSQSYVNEMLGPFGYELRSGIETYYSYYDLYLDGELVLKNISKLPAVQIFSTPTGELLAFLAHAVKDPDKHIYDQDNAVIYLVQNETISIWQEGPLKGTDPGKPPIWVAGELLVLGMGEHTYLEVRNSQHDLVFSFATSFGASLPLRRFQSWDNHWVMDMFHFLIQDGENLNEKYGLDQAFDWQLIDDKPFFFFRKGSRVGISYDGQFLSLQYDCIPYDWG